MEFSEVNGTLEIIGRGDIPDGYMGHWATVDFYFVPETGKTIARNCRSYFTYHTPAAMDKAEAIWLLHNHPTAKIKRLSTN
jgi:hypothetical protein